MTRLFLSQAKNNFLPVLQQFSHPLHLKLHFSLFIELISGLQILSIALLPILQDNFTGQDELSKTLNKLFLYMKPFHIFSPFSITSGALITIALCGLYFLIFFGAIIYMLYRFVIGSPLSLYSGSKIPSFCLLVHSKVLFYPIHCFLVKILDYNTQLDSSLFENSNAWIAGAIVLMVLNLTLATMKELYCFQIHQDNDTYGIKDNAYGLNILAHKTLAIILYDFIQNSTATLVIFNILFTIAGLAILHLRLPFYNLKMLKLSIVLSTIATWTSILSVAMAFDSRDKKVLLIILLTAGFIVKVSLIRLRLTIKSIFLNKNTTYYHIAHLLIIIRDYENQTSVSRKQEKTNKQTLYSMGFTAFKEETYMSEELEENKAYLIAIKEILEVYQKIRKNKTGRELLSLCIAQIYIQVFEDAFKAMLILSKLNPNKMSIVGRMSFEQLSIELEALNYRHTASLQNQGSHHLDYFSYKQKTQILKEYIKIEIEQHRTFWKLLSTNIVESMPVIDQGASISSSTSKIAHYWNSNFENSELIYVNASIMYGLYLKVLQSLPTGGSALVRKAFTAINNKQHPFKDILNIVLGNRAVVVASLEPDKVGKIVDTSSSVKKIFKMNKKGLLGTNVAMLMPGMIGAQHNDLIKKYHKHSKHSLNRVIKTYAKTFNGEYFAAEITLKLSPFNQDGLNVVASIEKTSEYEPVVIIDFEGNILECSKELADILNLSAKKSQLNIDTLCQEFKQINQAFNLIYSPLQDHEEEISQDQDASCIDNYLHSQQDNNFINRKGDVKYKEVPLISPRSSRRLLSVSMAENDNTALMSFDNKDQSERELLASPLPQVKRPTAYMKKEEAEKICEAFKYGKEINLLPVNQKTSAKAKPQLIRFKTEIEPLIFQGKLYKIIKLREASSSSLTLKGHYSVSQTATTRAAYERVSILQNPDDDFPDTFPLEKERESPRSKQHKCSIEPSSFKLKAHQMQDFIPHASTNPSKLGPENNHQVPLSESFNSKTKKKTIKAQSLMTSHYSQQVTARELNSSLKIEKQSPQISLAINMLYLAVIIIIGAILIDLQYTSKSIQYMSDTMDLVSLVNTRLGKALLAWQGMLGVYARACGFRSVNSRFPMHQAVAINSTLAMVENGIELIEKVDKFGDDDVVKIFYENSLSFWEPETHTLFDNQKIDGFTAQSIISDYNLYYARYNGTITNLNNSRRGLFALNNTANDYIVSLEDTTQKMSKFFQDTKNSNIQLLRVIVSLESLFVLIPCALTIYILVITIKLYKKLFHALCKIHQNSFTWRLQQLESIAALFEESIEDDISYFNEFKSQAKNTNIQQAESAKKVQHVTKEYRQKALVIHGVKYILVACVLTVVIIVLVANSFRTSVQSFNELDAINDRIQASFGLSSQVKTALPSFYFAVIFKNDTSFNIKNQDAVQQLIIGVDSVGKANEYLLNSLSNSHNEIDDPFFDELLRGKVCRYVSATYYQNCLDNTNNEAYGLLGLQPLYFQQLGILKSWATSDNPTQMLAGTLLTQFNGVVNNLFYVIYQLYDVLVDHLADNFILKAQQQKDQAVKMFFINVFITLFAMLLIRAIVLKKLRSLDIGIRRILRIIPYKIIEENKVMSFYLVRTFGKELEVLKRLL